MPAGLDLYMFLQDKSPSIRGFADFIGRQFFVAQMESDAAMGLSDIVVTEGAGLSRGYPTISGMLDQQLDNVQRAFIYVPLRAYMLPTTLYPAVRGQLDALDGLTLPTGGEVTVAISRQLSGCSICYRPSGGAENLQNVKIIHIQPDGLTRTPGGMSPGDKLQNILQATPATFAGDNGRATKVYGAIDINNQRANIIFLRAEGRWSMLSQRYVAGSQTVTSVDIVPLYE